ncbi:MAG TPA: hypothetical protein VFD13_08475, partial [Candidatus Kapabacteria bacterium]|nr:hypothetical protein [Candidatus Kapabacteria bacterium]
MKRIGTVSLIILSFVCAAQAQMHTTRVLHSPNSKLISVAPSAQLNRGVSPSSGANMEVPLAIQYDTVSYFGDTSNGNAWAYV